MAIQAVCHLVQMMLEDTMDARLLGFGSTFKHPSCSLKISAINLTVMTLVRAFA